MGPRSHASHRPGFRGRGRGILLALALVTGPAAADPGYYVVTPYPEGGHTWVDLRWWAVRSPGRATVSWPEVGLFHGVSDRWTTGVLASWIGDSTQATRLSTLNWINELMLTQGEWPVDLALHLQWIREGEAVAGQALELGLVMQTDVGRTQLNGNVILERAWDNGSRNDTRLKLQWQLRHRWRPGLHLGLQGFSELGRWDDWLPLERQSHRLGPAVFGRLGGEGERRLEWQAAVLWGHTYGRRGDMATLRAAWFW